MSTLGWILLMSFGGGALSVLGAAAIVRQFSPATVSALVSYAIGALLGAAFLELLPHALEHGNIERTTATVLGGIFLFFLLEKLVLWRHCHHEHCETHAPHTDHAGHDHGRSGLMILIGDSFHNFVDGVLIAAAFLESTQLGIVTSLAIIAHEIPQELGDFVVLINSGYSRARALAFNLLSSLATLVGALLAYTTLGTARDFTPTLLALAAASMIYVAVADLIPGLHRRAELRATVQQSLLIALGVSSIALVGALLGGFE
ncbi:ZIP family metal transporter [Rhodocyclus tenuis]|uniref:ZIP family metal transporter n=3 Tax=Rhodocyclus TaxID=1064 RepID=A0A6L5JT44_RHOTE|nr:ZIP family metal transporter [Rhodocyclus gracilis]MRD71787.1 ZIP family metal transporter [Rhodocyclus gracilis]NJA87819.1 ZIP family metal transporter [Rhodocyclus gracilis]